MDTGFEETDARARRPWVILVMLGVVLLLVLAGARHFRGRSEPTTEAVDRALALATDIKQCLDEGADAPSPGDAGETT